jgi:phosphoglycerate dehydrogenase-like enzyme
MKLVSLSPLPPESIASSLPPELGIEVVVPDERTEEAARRAVADADLVLGDFQSEIPVTAEVVAAMGRVRHFHQPTTGYDLVDVAALTAAKVPFTNASRGARRASARGLLGDAGGAARPL